MVRTGIIIINELKHYFEFRQAHIKGKGAKSEAHEILNLQESAEQVKM